MKVNQYWIECVAGAAEECGANLTREQIEIIAGAVAVSHENYGMCHGVPSSADIFGEQKRNYESRIAEIERKNEKRYETAIVALKRALKQHPSTNISVTEDSSVERHGGRTELIL